ncbi:MAG: SPASM domain-containing protein [Deltaproteobacteria bacterium]|nr:SPASM domain-containing protein [Deltaproteobacteria bacterium]
MDENLFSVIVSIDGDKERHDLLRKYRDGGDSYDSIAGNLAYLLTKKRIRLVCSMVIRDGLTLSDAFKMAKHFGADSIKAEHVRLTADDPLSLDPAGMKTYLEDLTGTLVDHYIGELRNGRQPLDIRLYSKILGLLTRTRRAFFCTAGELIFGIAANGEIYPCALHVGRRQSKLGHIDTGIDATRRRDFREEFGWKNQQSCRRCWTRHLCGGGCSAMVDRFGHEDCAILQTETEAAIAVYLELMESDPPALYGLLSPRLVSFIRGQEV